MGEHTASEKEIHAHGELTIFDEAVGGSVLEDCRVAEGPGEIGKMMCEDYDRREASETVDPG